MLLRLLAAHVNSRRDYELLVGFEITVEGQGLRHAELNELLLILR